MAKGNSENRSARGRFFQSRWGKVIVGGATVLAMLPLGGCGETNRTTANTTPTARPGISTPTLETSPVPYGPFAPGTTGSEYPQLLGRKDIKLHNSVEFHTSWGLDVTIDNYTDKKLNIDQIKKMYEFLHNVPGGSPIGVANWPVNGTPETFYIGVNDIVQTARLVIVPPDAPSPSWPELQPGDPGGSRIDKDAKTVYSFVKYSPTAIDAFTTPDTGAVLTLATAIAQQTLVGGTSLDTSTGSVIPQQFESDIVTTGLGLGYASALVGLPYNKSDTGGNSAKFTYIDIAAREVVDKTQTNPNGNHLVAFDKQSYKSIMKNLIFAKANTDTQTAFLAKSNLQNSYPSPRETRRLPVTQKAYLQKVR